MAEDVYTIPGSTNDIYQTLNRPNPGTRVQRNTAQHGDSGESKKNVYRAAAVCLGLMCLLLSASIIGLVVHNNKLLLQKAMFETRLDQLHTRYINLTEERYVLKRRLCELPGWQRFGCGCYYISTEEKNWEESRQYCRDNQSDLMVINSKAKQDLVESLNQRVWLGLTDTKTEGTFVWVDGTPLTTPTFWLKGEPNNNGLAGDGEDCVEFLYLDSKSKGWNDRSCSDYKQWICEIVIY